MRKVTIGFHLVMLVLVIATVMGAFSSAPTGSFAQDNTGYLMPLVGVLTVWTIGAIVLRVARRFSRS